jgi:tetratricopeptide (TPR) repeat protein
MYENLMEEFSFTNTDDPDVYYNENYRNFFLNHRAVYAALATSLANEGEYQKAENVVNFILEKVPNEVVPYDMTVLEYIQVLQMIGNEEKANELIATAWEQNVNMFEYLVEHPESYMARERQISFAVLRSIVQVLRQNGENEKALQYQEKLKTLYDRM